MKSIKELHCYCTLTFSPSVCLTTIIGGFSLESQGTGRNCVVLSVMGNGAIGTDIFCIRSFCTIPSVHAGTALTDHTELCGCEAPALDSTPVYQNNQID